MLKKFLVTIFLLSLSAPTLAQTVKVLGGSGTVIKNYQRVNAHPYQELKEGDSLSSKTGLTFLGDYSSFVATVKNGTAVLTLLRREGSCIRTFITYTNYIRLTPRPLTCPRSIIQILSAASGGSYTFRGTDAIMENIDATTSQLIVLKGEVDSANVGVDVPVNAGYSNFITIGKPPTQPVKIEEPTLEKVKLNYTPLGLLIDFKTSSLNKVYIQGQLVSSPTTLDLPTKGNSVVIEVINPLKESKVYIYPLPRKNS